MNNKPLFLKSLNQIDPSWNRFLTVEIVDIINNIENQILSANKEYTPINKYVLRFLEKPLSDVKVLILGQDPYPQKGVATGRAFEVGTLKSWQDKFTNISLKNIIRAIYWAYNNEYKKYSEIKKEIGLYFQLNAPQNLFAEWEKQGVLLLNTSFTCEIGKSNSHEKIWCSFTKLLLEYIAKNHTKIIWFLWGNNAKLIVQGIDINKKIETMHPMMCYNRPDRTNDFLFGKINCFKETANLINWLG